MSEYRRLISYIYEYEGKEKGKNVGFVKLEARNGQCRLNVNVKRMYVGGNAIGVYLLSKMGETVFLGNMFVRNGGGEFRITVDAENVEGTGVGLDGYFGLTVHDVKSEWRSYRTVWEDVEVQDFTEGFTAQEILPGSEERTQRAVIPGVAKEIEEEIARNAEMEEGQEKVLLADTETEAHETDPSDKEESQAAKTAASPELENPEVLLYLQETESAAIDPESLWQELRKSYPKIQPFDYDGNSEVLTIRPQDIGKLPRENWVYGNNSFLLHGYYNFRYLILIRLDGSQVGSRYLIGVPGHYYSNEKYMANMFGFPNFVLSKKQPPNDDRFGYWYTEIKMR